MGCIDLSDLQANQKRWVQAALHTNDTARQAQWTESIATGSKSFVENVKKSLGFKAKAKSITGDTQQYRLRENVAEFGTSQLQRFNTAENHDLNLNNNFSWKNS